MRFSLRSILMTGVQFRYVHLRHVHISAHRAHLCRNPAREATLPLLVSG